MTHIEAVKDFVEQDGHFFPPQLTAVSTFSAAGISDIGYALAGFRFLVHVELSAQRAKVGQANFPESQWLVGDIRTLQTQIVETYRRISQERLDLLVGTPPCQGMSSSNPSRGRRRTAQSNRVEEMNRLVLELIPIARELQPRVIVAENVRPVLTLEVTYNGSRAPVISHLEKSLSDYRLFYGVLNVADYGVPQDRRRALIVGVHKTELWGDLLVEEGTLPWPSPTHAENPRVGLSPWVSLGEWFTLMNYDRLDSKSKETAHGKHPLHYVPHYDGDRYLLVKSIPPNSGLSAYENDTCPSCSYRPVREGTIKCPRGHIMRNRPYVREGRHTRLVKGFHSSYRRMDPNVPAATITTNSSHIGSDFKIHPWENRVLSILECADLQSVPRSFDWSPALTPAGRRATPYLIRNLVGEAFPPYFTYLHGRALASLLNKGQAVMQDLKLARQDKATG